MSATDKISAVAIAGVGILTYLVLIPRGVEPVGFGWIKPDSMPNVLALMLTLLGVLQFFWPSGHEGVSARQLAKFAAYFLLLCGGLYAISRFGFFYAAPFLALALMLGIGERRPLWLLGGAIGVPAFIWLTVIWFLERALP